ncbi:MAG: PAS domain S-box protein [Calditrichaeota bacterium]|nr:PAS domain S-box protein [Calditrichota bacterium]
MMEHSNKRFVSIRIVVFLILILVGITGIGLYVENQVRFNRALSQTMDRLGEAIDLLHEIELNYYQLRLDVTPEPAQALQDFRRRIDEFDAIVLEIRQALRSTGQRKGFVSISGQLEQEFQELHDDVHLLETSWETLHDKLVGNWVRVDQLPEVNERVFQQSFQFIHDRLTTINSILSRSLNAHLKKIHTTALFSVLLALILIPLFYRITVRPIVQTYRRLDEAESRYRTIFSMFPNGIILLNSRLEVLDANPAALTMAGVQDFQQIKGMRVDTFVEESFRPLLQNMVNTIRTQKFLKNQRIPVTTRNGRKRLLVFDFIYLESSGPEPMIVANVVDMTEQESIIHRNLDYQIQLEKSLMKQVVEKKESETRYRILFESIKDGILILDKYFRIIHSNPAGTQLLDGSRRKKILGKTIGEFVADADAWEAFASQLRRKRHPVEAELEFVRASGEKFVAFIRGQAFRYPDRKDKNYLILIYDITQRKVHEKERQELQEQLRQAQKMEIVGQLAGGIAHDFNNLLTGIKGFCEFGMMKVPPDSKEYLFFQKINIAADRATELTKRLLAFSRQQPLNMKVVDLNEIVQEHIHFIRRVIGEQIELLVNLTEDKTTIKADPVAIDQILTNLTINARDAMPEGGKLIITTSCVQINEDYSRVHQWIKPGNYVMITVTDTGVGMTKEVQQRIFEPFFTTKEVGKGTGLGLSMVYGLIKQQQGVIHVYSEPGKGTTFRIYFPRVDKTPQPLDEGLPPEGIAGSETILVVEDDDLVRELMVEMLRMYGYRVIEAPNGEAAWNMFQEEKDLKVDLIIADTVMPLQGGQWLRERISNVHPEIPFLLISGYLGKEEQDQLLSQQESEFLSKPFNPVDLVARVRSLLDKARKKS